jgi:hypothetical protein
VSDQVAPQAERILPQADFALDELTVVVLLEGPKRASFAHDEAQRLANEHLRYTIGLVQAGHLLGAGAILDPDTGRQITGLGFSRLPAAEIAALEEQDPGINAGLEAFKVVTYRLPKGAIQFAGEAAPPRTA